HEVQEENEAIKNRGVAAVEQREEALGGMRHEVGEGHVARQDEGDAPGEKADREQRASGYLDHALDPDQRPHGRLSHRRGRKSKKLGGAMLEKQEPDDDANDAEGFRPILADATKEH